MSEQGNNNNSNNGEPSPTFDDGIVKIYAYKKAVVVDKYRETEITGEQQQIICDFIADNFGLSRTGIVIKSVEYSMSMDAMMVLKSFMKNYQGAFAYVDPKLFDKKISTSDFSNTIYLNNKLNGTYPSLEIAYYEIHKNLE